MNLDDLTPAGAGSLRASVTGPHGQAVAQFTATRHVDPSEIWGPFTRPTSMTANGSQGSPYGSFRPGHSLEHEPVDRAEQAAQHAAQDAGDYETAAARIRSALRPGGF